MTKSQQVAEPSLLRPTGQLFRVSLWMGLSITSFLGLMVGVRQLSSNLPVFEMLTLRSAVAFFILLLFFKCFNRTGAKTSRFRLHLTRNIFHFTGQYFWATGIILLPLAEVIAIEFTTPIWAVTFATLFLHEKVTAARMIALIAGFIGVCVIVRPGFETLELGTAVVFLATICFATSILVSKKLTQSESVWTILFYMSILQFFIGLIPTLYYWVWPVGMDYFWIFIIGISGLLAHLGLTSALSLADTASILPLDYVRLPATFVIGYLFYAETSDLLVFVGASIIFAANYYHLHQESQRNKSVLR